MLLRLCGAAAFLALLTPLSVAAQVEEEGPPPTLVISQWQCDWSHVGEIMEDVERILVPVWTEMRDEGILMGAGVYVHEWGDEWNVNMYRIAADKTAFFEAFEEEGRRAEALAGELNMAPEDNPFSQHCTNHRDNIYVMGPSVEGDDG